MELQKYRDASIGSVGDTSQQFVSMRVAKQLFGISVLDVRDVLLSADITPIPLAPKEIAGAINLRGRIVIVIDLRKKLDITDEPTGKTPMHVVVFYEGELYSLLVDSVGDVVQMQGGDFSKHPENLDARWKKLSSGVYKMEKELMVLFEVERLFKQVDTLTESLSVLH